MNTRGKRSGKLGRSLDEVIKGTVPNKIVIDKASRVFTCIVCRVERSQDAHWFLHRPTWGVDRTNTVCPGCWPQYAAIEKPTGKAP